MRSVVLCLSIIFFLPSQIAGAAKLVLGVYTSDKASSMYIKFSPIIKYLNDDLKKRMGEKTVIHLKIFNSYNAAQDAIVYGEIDFARFGPASYVLVKQRNPDIQLLLMENKKGKKRFNGVIAVLDNSKLKSLSDLKGTNFAFGNKRSTIGRYLAQAELIKAGVHGKDLKKIGFLGRHDKVFKAISVGDYDSGSLKESTFIKLNNSNQLRVIHTFENVSKPWLIRKGLPDTIKQSLKQSLLELKDKKILKTLKVNGFFETNDEMYNFVRLGMAVTADF